MHILKQTYDVSCSVFFALIMSEWFIRSPRTVDIIGVIACTIISIGILCRCVADRSFWLAYIIGGVILLTYIWRLDYMGFAITAFILWFIFAIHMILLAWIKT